LQSPDTVKIAQTLFSRCLESELKPNRLEFTKFLYLIDYCYFRFKGEKATDIDWVFYHYGPWAFEMPSLMEQVMQVFPVGWEDRTEEYGGYMPRFDPIEERLGMSLEGIISRIINAFKSRSTNDTVEWCYKHTEPMQAAKRGDHLQFDTIEVTREIPEFFPKPATWDMPKVPAALMEKRAAFKAKRLSRQKKYQDYKANLESPVYKEAMSQLEAMNTAKIPDLSKARVTWDEETVNALAEEDE
jgi:hypothetical protein